MNWLYKLERKFGRFGISHLMMYVTATMLAVFVVQTLGINVYGILSLDRAAIFSGEVWRLVTFAVLPPDSNIIFLVLALYFYYFIGSSLEQAWGSFSFTLYYLLGIISQIIAAMIVGQGSNTYLNLSLFFAFAVLHPDFEVRLFFFLPIKVKFLAYVNAGIFALSFLFSSWTTMYGWGVKASILASLLNFILFFGPGMIKNIKNNRRYSASRKQFRREMKKGGGDIWR